MTKDLPLPDFWTHLTERDRAILRSIYVGRRFDLSVIFAVADRCVHGCPRVLVCRSRRAGKPFPNLFWLTCPFLGQRCGKLESMQKIKELEEIFRARIDGVVSWHERYSALRVGVSAGLPDHGGGVGGIDWHAAPHAVKCLHLQAATWLGMRDHPAADWLSEQLGDSACREALCLVSLNDRDKTGRTV